MLLSIGEYIFEIDTVNFESMSKNINYSWKETERICNNPAYHATGKWKEEMELSGLVYTAHKTGAANPGMKVIDSLNDLAQKMKPQEVFTGYGEILGKFIILSVSETRDAFLPNGKFLKQSYTVKLAKYY